MYKFSHRATYKSENEQKFYYIFPCGLYLQNTYIRSRSRIANAVKATIQFPSLTVNKHKNRDRGQAHQANSNYPGSADNLQSSKHKVADVVRFEIRVLQLKHHGTVGEVPVLHCVLRHFGAAGEKPPRLVAWKLNIKRNIRVNCRLITVLVIVYVVN